MKTQSISYLFMFMCLGLILTLSACKKNVTTKESKIKDMKNLDTQNLTSGCQNEVNDIIGSVEPVQLGLTDFALSSDSVSIGTDAYSEKSPSTSIFVDYAGIGQSSTDISPTFIIFKICTLDGKSCLNNGKYIKAYDFNIGNIPTLETGEYNFEVNICVGSKSFLTNDARSKIKNKCEGQGSPCYCGESVNIRYKNEDNPSLADKEYLSKSIALKTAENRLYNIASLYTSKARQYVQTCKASDKSPMLKYANNIAHYSAAELATYATSYGESLVATMSKLSQEASSEGLQLDDSDPCAAEVASSEEDDFDFASFFSDESIDIGDSGFDTNWDAGHDDSLNQDAGVGAGTGGSGGTGGTGGTGANDQEGEPANDQDVAEEESPDYASTVEPEEEKKKKKLNPVVMGVGIAAILGSVAMFTIYGADIPIPTVQGTLQRTFDTFKSWIKGERGIARTSIKNLETIRDGVEDIAKLSKELDDPNISETRKGKIEDFIAKTQKKISAALEAELTNNTPGTDGAQPEKTKLNDFQKKFNDAVKTQTKPGETSTKSSAFQGLSQDIKNVEGAKDMKARASSTPDFKGLSGKGFIAGAAVLIGGIGAVAYGSGALELSESCGDFLTITVQMETELYYQAQTVNKLKEEVREAKANTL